MVYFLEPFLNKQKCISFVAERKRKEIQDEHRMHFEEEDGDCTQHFFWRCSCGYQEMGVDPVLCPEYSYKWPSYNSKICPRSRAKQQLEELEKYNVDLRRRVNGMKDAVYVV